ncbi:MAG: PDZ domain-containing protein [Gaiellaceae bacterium]
MRGASAGQRNVVVKLAHAGGIDGTLVGFSSPPSVRAQRQLPGAFMPAAFATVEGNAFHFRGLNPGSYQVAASGSDSDAAMVDVAPGQIATVTLKSRGSARVRGRVVEWSSGTAVGGFQCILGLRTSPAMPMWTGGTTALSDDNGTFELDDAPAGAIAVQCTGTGDSYSNGRCELTVAAGQEAQCEVPVVKIAPDVPWGSIGAQIMPGPMPARFITVTPKGIADRAGILAGDILSSIDGANVTKLTPWGAQVVLFHRAIGSTAHRTLARGDRSINADVTLQAQ